MTRETDGPVPDHLPHRYRDHRWHDGNGQAPATGLQAEHPKPPGQALLGPDGQPLPRLMHRVGFAAEPVWHTPDPPA